MKEEVIECPMKVVDIFPYGKVLVPDMKKLKEKIKYLEMRKCLGLKMGSHKTSTRNNTHPTKQTIQKGRGDVLNKDVDSVASVESKTGDLKSKRGRTSSRIIRRTG